MAKKSGGKKAVKGKKAAKKSVKKTSKGAKAVKGKKAVKKIEAGGFTLEKGSAGDKSFAKRTRTSIYKPILDQVRTLKVGEALTVDCPADMDLKAFRNNLSQSVRKRLEGVELAGRMFVRTVIDKKTGDPTNQVAIVCEE